MSAIVGIWGPDKQNSYERVLRSMAAATQHRCSAGETLVSGKGFAAVLQRSRASEPGSHIELTSPAGTLCLFDGRLFNRPQLAAAFKICDGAAVPTDSQLAGRAYAKWGDAFTEQLNGEFALAIFDAANHKLLLARDLLGTRPLYYTAAGGATLFATEIKNLLAHPEARCALDEDAVIDEVMGANAGLSAQTCFAGIRRVMPGTVVVVDAAGTRCRQAQSFDVPSCTDGRFDELAERARAGLRAAVANRMAPQGPTAVTISGGFDSSSIWSTAGGIDNGQGQKLIGLHLQYASGSEADESHFVDVLERRGKMPVRRLEAEPGFTRMQQQLALAGEAPYLSLHGNSRLQVLEACRAAGATTLLEGWFGDQVTYPIGYWLELLTRGRWTKLWHAMSEYSQWVGVPMRVMPQVLLHQLRTLAVPAAVLPMLRQARTASRHAYPAWYSARWRRRARERAIAQPAPWRQGSYHARSVLLYATSAYYSRNLETLSKISALFGVENSYPFFDRDLIQLVISIPGEVVNRDGIPRALFREAMNGIVPDEIRLRRGKARFGRFAGAAAASEADEVMALLGPDSVAEQLGFLDRSRLRVELEYLRPAWRKGEISQPVLRLASLAALESWLRAFFGAS
jgi:asparagine synthase (glutamine-hydrolysing)